MMSKLDETLETLRRYNDSIGIEIDTFERRKRLFLTEAGAIKRGLRLFITARHCDGMITFNFGTDDAMDVMPGIEVEARINNFNDLDYDFDTDPAYQDYRDESKAA